ncbi:Sporulation/nuclear morphology [Phakopsora pachyrhizi]|nr:Sporulation/nuclear morphology [Phakopsora pachyrhizi]
MKRSKSTSDNISSNLDEDQLKSVESFIPTADKETFKDLLIFEERLKQNAERLQSQRLKYEAFLLSIVVVILLLMYKCFMDKSPYQLIQYLYVGLLLVSVTTLILFFATGMYTDKVLYAYKFIPQTNRALRPFNMFLNTPPNSSWITNWFSRSIFDKNSSFSNSNTSKSNSSKNLSTSSSLTPINNSQQQQRPILINPRGELLFSSKVSSEFIDQYENYRTQWERRRSKR